MTQTLAAPPNNGGQLTIKQRLQSPELIAELGKAMPAHCKPERMARIAITAITRTPKLQSCTQASFFECLLQLSQWGLEPDGRRAHLIPYGDKCTLIIDYKGYVELAYRSGFVKNIHADVVRDGDLFDYANGRVLTHVPHFLRRDEGRPPEAGKVFAVYCIIELRGDTQKHEIMSFADVESIRKRSKAGNSGPWVTDWCEMAKKTAFRRASKWIPLSADIRDAFDRDEDSLDEPRSQQAGVRTVEDLGAILAGDAIEGEVEQVHESEPSPVANELVELARMDIAAESDEMAVDFTADGLIQRATDDETRAAINELRRARKAELRPAKGKAKQKELAQ